MNYHHLDTSIGPVLIAGDAEAIRRIAFPKNGKPFRPEPGWEHSARGPVGEAIRQLRDYFAGRRTGFDLPLAPEGTPFQRAVWREIAKVGFGETISYAELARRAGRPGSARAAGAATGRNPLGVIVPCHRIIGSDGSLTGYAGGQS